MNTELEKVKVRIRALASKTVDVGCTEQEALSAMSMVGKLLSMYNLTMQECDVRESPCVEIKIPTNAARRGAIDWVTVPLADLFYGKVWFNNSHVSLPTGDDKIDAILRKTWKEVTKEERAYHLEWIGNGGKVQYKKQLAYSFYIQEQDAEVLKYLFEVIASAIDGEAKLFRKTEEYLGARVKKSAYTSFQRGMARRIGERLREIRDQNEEALRQAEEVRQAANKTEAERHATGMSSGTSLIVLKGQVIKDEFAKTDVSKRLRTVATHVRVRDYNAYGHGRAAGDKVNLNRPIAGGAKVAGYI